METKNTQPSAEMKIKGTAFIIVIIGALFFWIFSCGSEKDESTSKKEEKEILTPKNSEYDGSVTQVVQYLKSNYLKDPDSYQSIDWSDVHYTDSTKMYFVRHKYRAKNGFGGYAVENQIFYMDSIGTILSIEKI